MIINKNGVDYTLTAEEEAEHLANIQQIQAEKQATLYQFKRAAEYPSMADYLDGIVKSDQAQIDAYIAACQAVKAKYPK
jgi:hypothetical protein